MSALDRKLTTPGKSQIAPIGHSDMTHLARLLMTAPDFARHSMAADIFEFAEMAARNVTGDPMITNRYGNGTISGAVMAHPARSSMPPETEFNEPEYLDCWRVAIEAVQSLASSTKAIPLKKSRPVGGCTGDSAFQRREAGRSGHFS